MIGFIEGYLLGGIVLAVLALTVERWAKGWTGYLLAVFPFTGFVYGLASSDKLSATFSSRPWLDHLGVSLSFGLDSLGLLFWSLITGIGTLIFVYASGYMDKGLGRLLTWLTAFMVAMLGVVSAQDLVTLFVAWEMTSITSFMLIGFKFDKEDSRRSALQALMVTGSGGLILLAGLVILGLENGSFRFADLAVASPVAVALIAIGCFTKSAQFPFHFWLPNAMAAPTPVSAYLHSATMVKAGVFLLAKFTALFGPQVWIAYVGAGTLVLASLLSLFERDLKRILAWSTVAALGSMVMLAGIGTPKAAEALAVTILAHACYKGALFMVAGSVDHLTGTRDVFRLGGLARKCPWLSAAGLMAALSMAGIPVLLGFVAKEAVLAGVGSALFTAAVFVGGVTNVVAAVNVGVRPFWFRAIEPPEGGLEIHASNTGLVLGPLVLGLLGVAGGFGSAVLGEVFLSNVASQVAGETVKNYLSPWHGVNTEFLIGIGAVGAGLVVAWGWPGLVRGAARLRDSVGWSWEGFWAWGFRMVRRSGSLVGDVMATTSFRQQMLMYFLTFIGILVVMFALDPFTLRVAVSLRELAASVNEVILCLFAGVAAFAAILIKSRMSTVATLGIVGVAVTLTFVTFGAPDLALTQLMIEVLSVVLFVLVFSHLPKIQSLNTNLDKLRDATVACAFGGTMMVLVLGVLSVPKPDEVSRFFGENSYTAAKGKNVVNTILVDFRGMDTMGEITVLCVAALGAHSLMRLRPLKRRGEEADQ